MTTENPTTFNPDLIDAARRALLAQEALWNALGDFERALPESHPWNPLTGEGGIGELIEGMCVGIDPSKSNDLTALATEICIEAFKAENLAAGTEEE